tara:strand:+ start:1199 stop:1804 length:606 start_codon:yes stop_codon:yes gene_type:complete
MNNEIVRLTTLNASHRVILLHGWGAEADDLLPIGESLMKDCSTPLELVSMNAPYKQSQGIGREWYPLFPPDWTKVPSAISKLQSRIRDISSDEIPIEKTFLFGFSQGAAMALSSGCDLPVAGLIICSGYPHPDWNVPFKMPPVLLSHGQYDEVVPLEASRKIQQMIASKTTEVEVEIFSGGHEIPKRLMPTFIDFINKLIL